MRGGMEKVYVSVRRESSHRSVHSVFIVLLSLVVFVVVFLFTRTACNDLREDLLGQLRKGREATELNNKLRLELSAITRARFLELKAKEKLGLKKPKDEEVYVLR
jgi:hypothetical protein